MTRRKPLVLAPGGHEFVTNDTLLVSGHLSGSGAATPTVSAGTILATSTDFRGSVTIPVGTLSVIITFATAFVSTPWVYFTTNPTGLTLGAAPAVTATSLTFTLVSNALGATISWLCIE